MSPIIEEVKNRGLNEIEARICVTNIVWQELNRVKRRAVKRGGLSRFGGIQP